MPTVKDFRRATGQPVEVEYNNQDFQLQKQLMTEECNELILACYEVDRSEDEQRFTAHTDRKRKALADLLKEMCDVMYVIEGTAVAFGWDLEEAYRRVCWNNMTKVTPLKKDPTTGKILKPENYKPVNLEDLVR